MKLSLTVEADAINVLALNMGRIVVDIDGIELTDLINVVNQNGYSLLVADEPGKLIVEDPIPPVARLNGIQCSTAHITAEDHALLFTCSTWARGRFRSYASNASVCQKPAVGY